MVENVSGQQLLVCGATTLPLKTQPNTCKMVAKKRLWNRVWFLKKKKLTCFIRERERPRWNVEFHFKRLFFPKRFQAIKTAERFDKSRGAVLAEVVKVRPNVIDWTKCSAENSVPQSMQPLMVRGGAPRRPRLWTNVTKSSGGVGVTFFSAGCSQFLLWRHQLMKMPLRRQAVDEAAALNSTKTEKTLTREARLSAPRRPHGSKMDPQRIVLEGKRR